MTTLGKQNEELKKDKDGNVKEEIEYEIVIKDNMEVDKILTKEEKEKLQTGMKSTTSAIEAAYFHLRGMLAKWREGIQDAEHKSSPPLHSSQSAALRATASAPLVPSIPPTRPHLWSQ